MAEEKNIVSEEHETIEQTSNPVEDEMIEPVFAESTEEPASNEEGEDDKDAKIAELEAKLEEAENRYLRLQADYDNSRRRAKLDLEATQKYRAQSLISDLLPALDNFERAMKIEADSDQVKSLLHGMEMVYRNISDALQKEGAEVIEAVGKEFDPHLHQAVMQVEDASYDSNIVVEEFQKGYKLKDRVIRPSMVKVNQ
ncbi:nucleotide exchange factor GrpE [Cytobacillus spongiae]|uniref:nucleotide exchange factor GrpE n=1 Tax=Cytobacillus spongiae TaxID=2901381 RepID=UPI001F302F69|nr:nucleotide exchange factor GrpE [Cytobacillus spongiae]UII54933.1 nucleotide exchange factor GrpE [Cytobacillus spongiae]